MLDRQRKSFHRFIVEKQKKIRLRKWIENSMRCQLKTVFTLQYSRDKKKKSLTVNDELSKVTPGKEQRLYLFLLSTQVLTEYSQSKMFLTLLRHGELKILNAQ